MSTDDYTAEWNRQRKIGQQLMLIRLLIVQNRKADLGWPSFIELSDIALWMDEKEETVDGYISDYESMTPYCSARAATGIFSRISDNIDIGYVFRTMYHFGPKYVRSILKKETFDYADNYRKNWAEFNAGRNYRGEDQSILGESGFRVILECYKEYYLKQIRLLKERGYDKDVIWLMTYGSVPDEEYKVYRLEKKG